MGLSSCSLWRPARSLAALVLSCWTGVLGDAGSWRFAVEPWGRWSWCHFWFEPFIQGCVWLHGWGFVVPLCLCVFVLVPLPPLTSPVSKYLRPLFSITPSFHWILFSYRVLSFRDLNSAFPRKSLVYQWKYTLKCFFWPQRGSVLEFVPVWLSEGW